MQLNPINNVNFKGALIINDNSFSDIVNIARSSHVLQDITRKIPNDVHLIIKHRHASKFERFRLRRDDDLFRVIFKIKKPVRTIFDKIVNFITGTRIPLTSNYHGAPTILSLLINKDHLESVFAKYMKKLK